MQQLTLPLTLSGTEPLDEVWFQEMLQFLGIRYSPAWPDQFGLSLRNWFNSNGHVPVKTLSLFSGCGGLLSTATDRANFSSEYSGASHKGEVTVFHVLLASS